MIFGRPSGVVCSPAAPGSTPVSKMATTTPLPSYSGCACRVLALPSLKVTPMRGDGDDAAAVHDAYHACFCKI